MRLIKTKHYLIGLAILLALFIIANIFDYQISQTVYASWRAKPFGHIFTGYLFLIYYTFVFTVLFNCFFNPHVKKTWQKVIYYVFVVFLFALFGYFNFKNTLEMKEVYGEAGGIINSGVVTAVDICAGFWLSHLVCKKANDKKLLMKLSLCALLIIGGFLGIQLVLNALWSRPRPVIVFDNCYGDLNSFKALYQPMPFECFKAQNTGDLHSFPSGHTGHFMVVLCGLVLSTKLFPKMDNDKTRAIFFYGWLAMGLLMGFGRMLAGQHFLGDITFSCIVVTTLVYVLGIVLDILETKFKLILPREVEEK